MAWLRSREIKPGVYETQSAGFHALKQIGIAAAVLIGAITVGSALFSGSLTTVALWLIPVFLLVGLHFSHRQDQKAKGIDPEPRRPGPWD